MENNNVFVDDKDRVFTKNLSFSVVTSKEQNLRVHI